MSILDDIQQQAEDTARDIQQQAEDTVRSIPRQFDDTEGGGFADEIAEIYDPTRRTSEETESDIRALTGLGLPGLTGAQGLLGLSDYLDTEAGRTPPGSDPEADPDQEQTNPDPAGPDAGFWERVFRGNTPQEQAQEDATSAILNNPKISLLLGGVLLVVVLWFIRPFVAAFQ